MTRSATSEDAGLPGGRAFNWRGEGVDRATWLDPPQKRLNGRAPQNPTETEPRAPEVARARNSAKKKKENEIFGISASRGFRMTSFAMYLVEGKFDHFQWSKKLSVPLAPDFMITD